MLVVSPINSNCTPCAWSTMPSLRALSLGHAPPPNAINQLPYPPLLYQTTAHCLSHFSYQLPIYNILFLMPSKKPARTQEKTIQKLDNAKNSTMPKTRQCQDQSVRMVKAVAPIDAALHGLHTCLPPGVRFRYNSIGEVKKEI